MKNNLSIRLKNRWEEKPLTLILFAGAFFRLLAVIFSRGFGFHDDHFLVVEAAQSWVDGFDYNNWIPGILSNDVQPSGHSLLYPGIHYLLFKFMQSIGIYDPQIKMFFIRLIHAAYSLITIWSGFKIAEKLGGVKAARMTGILLALLWFMPMMSVRNLVEMVCIPPLMIATWIFVKDNYHPSTKKIIIAGILLGLSFSIRFQTATFIAGFGLAMILNKSWRQLPALIFGIIISVGFVQAITDMIIWHRPFAEFFAYVKYNADNAYTYITQGWYTYILLVAGILIFPISLMLMYGYLRMYRKHLLLFLPAFIFFLFHSAFPNKQERFIFPAVPFIITLGSIGWYELYNRINSKKIIRFTKVAWIIFWVLNIVPRCFLTVAYSKKNRVEAMTAIRSQGDLKYLLIDEPQHGDFTMPPQFYSGKWGHVFYVTRVFTIDSLKKQMVTLDKNVIPNYILFNDTNDIDKRVADMKTVFPKLNFLAEAEPGFVDRVLYRLNRHNYNVPCLIYKTE
jgi:hypothetical protein